MIISNSSPLIALGRIQKLDIFQSLFGEIYIPDAVYQETVVQTTQNDQKYAVLSAIQIETIKVIMPSLNHPFRRKLGLGEIGVLNLALEKSAQQVIIDDRKARNEAIELGISVAYTTDILKIAEEEKIFSYGDAIDQLRAIGIYLPESS